MVVKKAETDGLVISALKRGRIMLNIIGETPLYFNAMSLKAKHDLLIGGGKKTTAQKKEIKHNPEQEFRDSVYRQSGADTILCIPSPAFKGAMCTAALETPGVTKTSVQRLIFMPQHVVSIYGRPLLKCDVVRSADMNKTPDVRTRAYLPRWCCQVEIAFMHPQLSAVSVYNLMSNAGMIVGVGDFRQEKGRGSYGAFRVYVDGDMGDAQSEWDDIVGEDADVQADALMNPVPADEATETLLGFVHTARQMRAA